MLLSKTGILEYPFSTIFEITVLKLVEISIAKISILGRIACLVSVLPNETIPFKIFCSSFDVFTLLVNSKAWEIWFILKFDFCFPSSL